MMLIITLAALVAGLDSGRASRGPTWNSESITLTATVGATGLVDLTSTRGVSEGSGEGKAYMHSKDDEVQRSLLEEGGGGQDVHSKDEEVEKQGHDLHSKDDEVKDSDKESFAQNDQGGKENEKGNEQKLVAMIGKMVSRAAIKYNIKPATIKANFANIKSGGVKFVGNLAEKASLIIPALEGPAAPLAVMAAFGLVHTAPDLTGDVTGEEIKACEALDVEWVDVGKFVDNLVGGDLSEFDYSLYLKGIIQAYSEKINWNELYLAQYPALLQGQIKEIAAIPRLGLSRRWHDGAPSVGSKAEPAVARPPPPEQD